MCELSAADFVAWSAWWWYRHGAMQPGLPFGLNSSYSPVLSFLLGCFPLPCVFPCACMQRCSCGGGRRPCESQHSDLWCYSLGTVNLRLWFWFWRKSRDSLLLLGCELQSCSWYESSSFSPLLTSAYALALAPIVSP